MKLQLSNCINRRVHLYLVLYYTLNSSTGEVETVTQCKITTVLRFGPTASEFFQLLLHRTILPLDEN